MNCFELMHIDLSLSGSKETIDTFLKCASPENDGFVIMERVESEKLTIKINNVKLSSIYSLTDEFLKIFEIVEKIFENYS
jgi:hypothetical protein